MPFMLRIRISINLLLGLLFACTPALIAAQTITTSAISTITVDAGQKVGLINKELLGVNHGPLAVHQAGSIFTGNNAVDLSPYYRDAGIRSVRLDEFGCIDIKSLFPDFSADPDRPENFRFLLADRYLKAIHDLGEEIVFRMGYSEKPNRSNPPGSNEKWTKVMIQIIKHYNDGWANGYRWNIKYWEVWNEPSGLGWTGTTQEYCQLYATVSKAIKRYNPNLLVGGPALGGPDAAKDRAFAEYFIKYCHDHQLPLDFFSWHLYFNKPQEFVEHATRHRNNLDANGFKRAKIFLTEWGWLSGNGYPPPAADLASINDAAADISAMAVLHDRVDMAHFYVGGALAGYPWGLFDFVSQGGAVSANPRKSYFAFMAYRTLTDTPDRLRCNINVNVDQGGCAVLAGMSRSNSQINILLSNYGTQVKQYKIEVKNIPWKGPTTCETVLLDSTHNLEVKAKKSFMTSSAMLLEEPVELPSVCLIKLKPAVPTNAKSLGK